MRPYRINLAIAMVSTVGRGLRFFRNDRTVEVIKFIIIWLTLIMKQTKAKNYSSGSRQLTSNDARDYRVIHRLKLSQSVKFTTVLRVPSKTGKMIVTDLLRKGF